jgi:signal peptidase I
MDDWYQDEAAQQEAVHQEVAEVSEPRHHAKSWLKEVIQIILIVALVRIGMDTFLPRYVVDGASMQPNFATSQRVIVDRLTMMISGPARGDVIVLDSPQTKNELLIKRVIGLPNETIVIQDGRVYVNGILLDETYINDFCTMRSCNGEWQLGPDQYFVLGDNRSHSLDSHAFGPVSRSAIIGIARVRYWPPDKAELITAPDY